MATLVPIVVTEDGWLRPDGTSPTGTVRFDLLENITSPGYVSAYTEIATLDNGSIVQQLFATDADSDGDPIVPSTTQYKVVEDILGAPEQEYYITVPAVPPGSRTIADAVIVQGTQTVNSASANFTDDDENAYVLLEGFPPGTQINEVISSTEVQLTTSPPISATGVTMMIGASASLQELRPT